jgi:hypothetical protein
MRTTVSVLLLAFTLAACGGPFAAARKEGTADAYRGFIASNPNHPKVGTATVRAEQLDWEGALKADTSSAYALYVVGHPSGPHVDEARQRGDDKGWEEALRDRQLASFQAYLAAYPEGAHATEAANAIEDLVVEEARYADSVDAWGRYMFRYPEGRYIDEARAKRDARGWAVAKEKNSRFGYEAYLRNHPNGEHRQEARDWLYSLAVQTLKPVVVVGSTWRPEWAARADRAGLQRQLDTGLLTDLKTRFTLLPTVVEDEVVGEHPADRHGREPGVGLLVVAVSEEVGRTFEPSGHATTLPTTVSIYVAPTDEPLWSYTFTSTTPETIYGSTEEALYTEAVDDWGATLRGIPVPVETLLDPKIP